MIVVFVFVKASTPRALPALGAALADVTGVYECYSVTGEHDFIAILRLRTHDEIAEVVTEHIATLPDIASTETVIAFRSYSSEDLRFT